MRLLLFTTLFCTCIANPTVKTKFGDVAGFVATGREGNEADVFLGVPFAKPPIGELRFEKPEPLEPWTGTLNATKFGHVCIPHGRHAAFGHDYSEDCLTLNVVRPKDVDGTLPVLVWIHGGGYQVGSAPWHGYKAFVDNYVHRGIIVVSIQYRLGFLGFFTDGTKNAPGNMGMFDQVMALKWIKENIADFGGDNQDITVWGYSAGASSTSFLTISSKNPSLCLDHPCPDGQQDIRHQAILMNSLTSVDIESALLKRKIQYIGCSGKDVKKCLKERTIEEMFQAMDHIGLAPPTVDFLKYTPVIDGDFLPKHPYDLMAESPRKPTIMGLSSKEFLFFSGLNLLREIHDVGVESHEIPTIDKDFLWDALDTKILHTEGLDHLKEPIMKLMVEHYIDSKPHNVSDNEFYFNQYNKIFSDTNMNAPIIREMRRRLELGTDVWAYKLEYFNDIMFGEDFPEYAKGSPHVNEYHYLFEMTLIGEIDTTKGIDRDVKEVFMSFIASFVRSGVPKVQDVEWQKVDSPDNIPYLNIAHNLTLKRNLFEEESKLFEDIRKLGFDVVDPTFHVRHAKTEL